MTTEINQLLHWQCNPKLSKLPTVSAQQHRYGMRHFAMGVTVITSGNESCKAGLTATAVCSVTADPPRLVVFINKNVYASEIILKTGSLCVNVLSSTQEEVAKAFSGGIKEVQGEQRFQYGQWKTMLSGAPVLEDAIANFDCRVIKVFDESTHHAFLCEVIDISEPKDKTFQALLYLDGGFRHIPLMSELAATSH